MIRPYREEDFETVVEFWFHAVQAAEPELCQRMGYEIQSAREYFKNVVIPENKMWVYELDDVPVGLLAMQNDYIDRLYVDVNFHRRGIGTALIEYARSLSPDITAERNKQFGSPLLMIDHFSSQNAQVGLVLERIDYIS